MTAFPHMSASLPQLATPDEVAPALRMSAQGVRRACRRGELPAVRMAGRWLIKVEALAEMLGADASAPSPSSALATGTAGRGGASAPGTGGSSPTVPVQRSCVSDTTSAAAGTDPQLFESGPGGGEIDTRGVA